MAHVDVRVCFGPDGSQPGKPVDARQPSARKERRKKNARAVRVSVTRTYTPTCLLQKRPRLFAL